jgi:hypothetical protein
MSLLDEDGSEIIFDMNSEDVYVVENIWQQLHRKSQQLIKNGATIAGVVLPGSLISDSTCPKGFLEYKFIKRLSPCMA